MTNWHQISAISNAHLPISLHQLWEVCRVLLLRSNSFDDCPSSIAERCMSSRDAWLWSSGAITLPCGFQTLRLPCPRPPQRHRPWPRCRRRAAVTGRGRRWPVAPSLCGRRRPAPGQARPCRRRCRRRSTAAPRSPRPCSAGGRPDGQCSCETAPWSPSRGRRAIRRSDGVRWGQTGSDGSDGVRWGRRGQMGQTGSDGMKWGQMRSHEVRRDTNRIKGLSHLGFVKYIRVVCKNVEDALLNMFVNNPPPPKKKKKIAYFARYWCVKYLGLWRHLGCAFYSTALVLRQTIYCGTLLFAIALVIATC